MQIADGSRESTAICREEWQAFCKYFVSPLVQKSIAERYARPESATEVLPDADGMTFRQVVDHWRQKLDGAYACVAPHTARVKEVRSDGQWRAYKNVPPEAYKPTTGAGQQPFFVTADRSGCHSFWLVLDKVHLSEPGIPLLQLIKAPPRGHDWHQIVEHAIGALKGYVYRCFGAARARGHALTTKLVAEAIAEGAKLFTAASWAANLPRLLTCLRLIAAPEGQLVEVTVITKAGKRRTSMQKGTGGKYAPVRVS